MQPQPFLPQPYPLALKEDHRSKAGTLDAPESALSHEPGTGDGGNVLVCKCCHLVVTRHEFAMEVDGKQHHVFFNPHGMVFELGCFASARNVVPVGPRTDEFTWFPGYDWQAVLCRGCQAMLGWRYTSQHGGFYGLILSALVEEAGRKA